MVYLSESKTLIERVSLFPLRREYLAEGKEE